ncbi:hypothetical protein ACIHFD_33640 [Nonomuraea sp. NPDC051941]|uniref:hypothetical protein n=1 Tax=Nonomuraea sp. NPDC051941 TaxID=3364373 RepID=UPI0037C96B04
MRTCPRCGQKLPIDAFGRKSATRLQAYCRECNREYQREHYRKNSDIYRVRRDRYAAAQREEVFRNLMEYLARNPCIDCGEADPIVLQFDHVRGEKVENVGSMLTGRTRWVTVAREIAKCEVRCANCHLRKTARQFGWRKYLHAVVDE